MLAAVSAAAGISPAQLPSSLRHQIHRYNTACEMCSRDDGGDLLIKGVRTTVRGSEIGKG